MSWPERMRSTASCTVRITAIIRASKTPGQASVSRTCDSRASRCRAWAIRRSSDLGAPGLDLELVERPDQLGRSGRGDGHPAPEARQEVLVVPVEADVPPEDLRRPAVGDQPDRWPGRRRQRDGSRLGGRPGLAGPHGRGILLRVLDPGDFLAFADGVRRGLGVGLDLLGQDVVGRDVIDGPGRRGCRPRLGFQLPFGQVVGIRGDLLQPLQRPASGLDLDDLLPVLLGLERLVQQQTAIILDRGDPRLLGQGLGQVERPCRQVEDDPVDLVAGADRPVLARPEDRGEPSPSRESGPLGHCRRAPWEDRSRDRVEVGQPPSALQDISPDRRREPPTRRKPSQAGPWPVVADIHRPSDVTRPDWMHPRGHGSRIPLHDAIHHYPCCTH